MDHEVKLSVFFCGTNGTIENGFTQISLFYRECRGLVLDGVEFDLGQKEYKIGFDGCGITNGFMGGIFGYGLGGQCQQVLRIVERLIQEGKRVSIVGLGLSRGAIALLMLVQLLQPLHQKVTMNLVLFDPVPGNSIYQARWDFLGLTNTSLSYNLSDCFLLKNVYLIYPYEPLPDLIFHAPLIPVFCERSTKVEYDVIPGCHQGAFFSPNMNTASYIAHFMVKEKLEEYGMPLEMEPVTTKEYNDLLEMMDMENFAGEQTTRHTHSLYQTQIVSERKGTYLNKYHESLLERKGSVKDPNPDYPLYRCFVWTKD